MDAHHDPGRDVSRLLQAWSRGHVEARTDGQRFRMMKPVVRYHPQWTQINAVLELDRRAEAEGSGWDE
jgi:hypothetical protein